MEHNAAIESILCLVMVMPTFMVEEEKKQQIPEHSVLYDHICVQCVFTSRGRLKDSLQFNWFPLATGICQAAAGHRTLSARFGFFAQSKCKPYNLKYKMRWLT